MNEDTVWFLMHDFLETRFGACGVYRDYVDLVCVEPTHIVENSEPRLKMLVECKGTHSDFDRMLGQILRYYLESHAPIFVAAPDDYHAMPLLEEAIKKLNLPVGIILVSGEGRINLLRMPPNSEELSNLLGFCPKCKIAMHSLVAPTGEVEGYICQRCQEFLKTVGPPRVAQVYFLKSEDRVSEGSIKISRMLAPISTFPQPFSHTHD